jgi:hypothetical protein
MISAGGLLTPLLVYRNSEWTNNMSRDMLISFDCSRRRPYDIVSTHDSRVRRKTIQQLNGFLASTMQMPTFHSRDLSWNGSAGIEAVKN